MDLNEEMVDAWLMVFGDFKNVKIKRGDITKTDCDAIVSPANSFGFMDGGVDYGISNRLGWSLQYKLREGIRNLEEKELLIGKSLVLETGDETIKYLISAPTMRVPMEFNIAVSINAYLAMKAVLIAVKKYEDINTVAIPGFCTGTGNMKPLIAAKQMYHAYKEIELGESIIIDNITDAKNNQIQLNPEGRIFS